MLYQRIVVVRLRQQHGCCDRFYVASRRETTDKGFEVILRCLCAPRSHVQVARYLTPNMLATAAAQGIELCLIDYQRPLHEQGIFDGIVHKLRPNKGMFCSVPLTHVFRRCGSTDSFTCFVGFRMGAQLARILPAAPGGDCD